MPLSRLDNFLKNVRGNILYVNPNDLDATDSIENQGNSLARPFKTIQRALIEASRFSYQAGLNNDRFGQTTILLYPGEHTVDNRPGWIPDGTNNFRLRSGATSDNLPPFDLNSNFDLTTASNELYKLNSVHGGVIIPRGTSIVGLDLRKTKIRPKYVPDPTNDNIERSAIFRVTGTCYFWQFSIFDADPNGTAFTNYTDNVVVPNFSHHKLTCFEYADGVNGVNIADTFQTYSTTRTDLDMYYEKVGRVYGQASGRAIEPDYPSASLDIQPKIDEYRIVGATSGSVGIATVTAAGTTVTVTLESALSGLDVDTPIVVDGISAAGYDGKQVVSERISTTQFKYKVQNTPVDLTPTVAGATVTLNTDTVTSASPYIFNVSLRSVFGACGLHADGSAATGFKSMVVAQFTGIGLQKDDNAFVLYNTSTGEWEDKDDGKENLSTNSRAVYKPTYKNFHIKASNNAVIQNVSIFAIGYAEHFVCQSGGDMSVTNSNSNFGSRALIAEGFRSTAFNQDNTGYVSHVIPPQVVSNLETPIEFAAIDVAATVGVTTTASQLYLYDETNPDKPPANVLEGYRVGARTNDDLRVLISQVGVTTEYASRIVMPNSNVSSEKRFEIGRVGTANSISNSVITFTEDHNFINGESIRVISETGQLPDGIEPNKVYFAVVDTTLNNAQLKLAATLTDALTFDASTNATNLTFNAEGGELSIVSRVSDKNSGDVGHPIQFNDVSKRWYINVSTASTDNQIGIAVSDYAVAGLGSATPRSFINRLKDDRALNDRLYRMRYVIPASSTNAGRPPQEGFILQESNTTVGLSTAEIQTYFGSGSITEQQQRNFRLVADASWDSTSNTATIYTEVPHDLEVGSEVEIINIKSSENTSAAADTAYNRTLAVSGISSAKAFTIGINTDPGTFQNDTTARNTSLPHFKRKKFSNVSIVYRTTEAQKYIQNEQDGVYYVTVLNGSNTPAASPFQSEEYTQPVTNLYPQLDRDNPLSDPAATKSFASSDLIGEVVIDDPKGSVTREAFDHLRRDFSVGVGITDIVTGNAVSIAGTEVTLKASHDHGLNRITKLSILNDGAGYGNNSGAAEEHYNARLVGTAGSTTGEFATAKVFISAAGNVTDVKIMDGGSAYGIGNTMQIVGIPTFAAPFEEAVVQVEKIYDNINNVVDITGITSAKHAAGNQLYKIVDIAVGAGRTFRARPLTAITGVTTTGIGTEGAAPETLTNAFMQLNGPALTISSFAYENTSGIASVTTDLQHGLSVDRRVRIVGAGQDLYNGEFVVTRADSLTTLELNVGISTNAPTATGDLEIYPLGVAAQGGDITIDRENVSGRMIAQYAGITTTMSAIVADEVTQNFSITNPGDFDVNIGDYLEVDSEIVRVKTTTSTSSVSGVTNPIVVLRGQLGTKAATHELNAVVRRVKPIPVELRRHSIIRASAHTFEYVGFGPGNYSTALPDRQDRAITETEELLSQSTKRSGGINFYTGMNDRGISYSGNKKLSSVTGEEEVFDTPVQSVTGEDVGVVAGFNLVQGLEANITRSIKVEGGPSKNALSEFIGPVVFGEKVTSTSTKGLEVNNLFIQGGATISRNITVGIATPSLAGDPGDIVFNANPSTGGYAGWVFTTNNEWQRFGAVSNTTAEMSPIFDTVGIGTTGPGDNLLQVGSGTGMLAVDTDGVGIGTTANGMQLHVVGNTNVVGTVTATSFVGEGSGLTNLNVAASGWSPTDASDGYYNSDLTFIGIGTSTPGYTLEVGDQGDTGLDLVVNGMSKFTGLTTVSSINVTGILTASNATLTDANVSAGIVTATNLQVGTALTTASNNVGVGTAVPRAKLDIEGAARFKTYSEHVEVLDISAGNVVEIDLSLAQSFTLTVDDDVDSFTITNPPSGSTSFSIKILQDGTGDHAVGIDTFKTSGGTAIPVNWPGGGVVPIMTQTASRADIYSYKTFDGGSSFYGVVGGQNFA
jgi:hypothetical protein